MTYEEYVHAVKATSRATWFFLHTKRPVVSLWWAKCAIYEDHKKLLLDLRPNAMYHRW